MKDLPGAVNVDDYFEDTTVCDKLLPGDVINVVDEYDNEIITYMGITNNTKGELTIPNVDRFYELIVGNDVVKYYVDTIDDNGYYNHNNDMYVNKDENCYVKIRLIFDDGC